MHRIIGACRAARLHARALFSIPSRCARSGITSARESNSRPAPPPSSSDLDRLSRARYMCRRKVFTAMRGRGWESFPVVRSVTGG